MSHKKTKTLNEIEEFKRKGMELPNNSPVKFTFQSSDKKKTEITCTVYFGTKTYEEVMKEIITEKFM